jgi:manganese oxidase
MGRTERNTLGVLSAAVAIFALVIAGVAVAVSNNNVSEGSGGGGGASAPTPVAITLSEFAISPSHVEAPAGRIVFAVRNNGSLAHNFTVEGLGETLLLNAGESATLEVDASAGTYKMLCTVAGHEASGMVGELVVGGAGGSGSAAGATTTADATHTASGGQTPEEMEAAMASSANQFLQVNGLAEPKINLKDQGLEGADLAPIVLPDGTKEFDLTAKVVDWEVEPGKFVKAWTYNGVVPGPTLRVNEGDKIRIVLKNELPEYTTLHPHGCSVPNDMDGFDPFTQDAIAPGQSFTYEWVATGPKVCMYHSHHNAQVQVPNGLVGALYIGKLDVPAKFTADTGKKTWDREITMVLNDAGTIGLSLNGRSFPGTTGYLAKKGETFLVHYFNEGLQVHPMHLHAPHGLVFAKDGVELDSPFYSDTINVAPGERWSVLYTFTEPGVWAWHCHILTHAETPQGFHYMATAVVVQ